MRHPFVRAAAALLLYAAACAMLGASPRPLRDGEAGPAVTAENTSVSTYPAESGVTESVGSGTDSSTAETMPADLPANLDSLCIGRLSIPDCGIDVSLYDASDLTDEERQAVTDLDGAAVWIDESDASECKQPLIADHNFQGFSRLAMAVTNQSVATLTRKDGTVSTYQAVRSTEGQNLGCRLVDSSGNNLYDENLDGFATYTCLEDYQHVLIVEWAPERQKQA